MIYEVHFGKSYPYLFNLYTGTQEYDKDYHRIRKYKNKEKAERCFKRANNCKWVDWTDIITKEDK